MAGFLNSLDVSFPRFLKRGLRCGANLNGIGRNAGLGWSLRIGQVFGSRLWVLRPLGSGLRWLSVSCLGSRLPFLEALSASTTLSAETSETLGLRRMAGAVPKRTDLERRMAEERLEDGALLRGRFAGPPSEFLRAASWK